MLHAIKHLQPTPSLQLTAIKNYRTDSQNRNMENIRTKNNPPVVITGGSKVPTNGGACT